MEKRIGTGKGMDGIGMQMKMKTELGAAENAEELALAAMGNA
jgi:hypothetical protein